MTSSWHGRVSAQEGRSPLHGIANSGRHRNGCYGADFNYPQGENSLSFFQTVEVGLDAGKSERTLTRLGYRSGYKNRYFITRVGKLKLMVPQDRNGLFRTELFERYQRSEKALVSALMEMYVTGVSTRKIKHITEKLCGHEFSAATVSQLNKKMDEELSQFANRHLEES